MYMLGMGPTSAGISRPEQSQWAQRHCIVEFFWGFAPELHWHARFSDPMLQSQVRLHFHSHLFPPLGAHSQLSQQLTGALCKGLVNNRRWILGIFDRLLCQRWRWERRQTNSEAKRPAWGCPCRARRLESGNAWKSQGRANLWEMQLEECGNTGVSLRVLDVEH